VGIKVRAIVQDIRAIEGHIRAIMYDMQAIAPPAAQRKAQNSSQLPQIYTSILGNR